jgi:predicted nuclease of restriction endonuclease-like (RecB) superfamily
MNYNQLIAQIAQVQSSAQAVAARLVNQLLTYRNWLIGAYIFEFEQNGEDRAAYGEQLLKSLADDLASQGQSGCSSTNLKYCRQFALAYPALAIGQTASDQLRTTGLASAGQSAVQPPTFPALAARQPQQRLEWQDESYYARLFSALSWSHLLELARIDDPLKRAFYELECVKSRWPLRELKRQMDSLLYERVGLSKDKEAVLALAETGHLVERPATVLRDPYVLEFLELGERPVWSEAELEQALIDHLQKFLHELGRDFCFVERQFRITVGGEHYHLDLLFFHRGLRCLIAIELKLGRFRHEYAGQMNFYLNYLKEQVGHPDENPPVGIILCAEKDAEEVHYATAGLDQQLFVSRYLVALPSEEQLTQWLHEEQEFLERLRSEERSR